MFKKLRGHIPFSTRDQVPIVYTKLSDIQAAKEQNLQRDYTSRRDTNPNLDKASENQDLMLLKEDISTQI